MHIIYLHCAIDKAIKSEIIITFLIKIIKQLEITMSIEKRVDLNLSILKQLLMSIEIYLKSLV